MTGNCLPWVRHVHKHDEIYNDDTLIYLEKKDSTKSMKGIGNVTLKQLSEHGVSIVKDVLTYDAGNMTSALRKIRTYIGHFKVLDSRPPPTDHRKDDNPYESLYGRTWRDEVINSTAMKPFVCITELVTHIYKESEHIMKGTVHEDSWYFYHDALSLMTSSKRKIWMREKGYLDKWILPEENLNKGTRYAYSPVGNSPELMPLDCSLFEYLHKCVNRHVVYTLKLHKGDDKKFSLATIPKAVSAYTRIWNDPLGEPSSHIIIQDIDKTLGSMVAIYENDGAVVQGLGNKTGKRHVVTGGWGGLVKGAMQIA